MHVYILIKLNMFGNYEKNQKQFLSDADLNLSTQFGSARQIHSTTTLVKSENKIFLNCFNSTE